MTQSPTPTNSFALSREEQDQFREQGWLGPFSVCSPEAMARDLRPGIERVLETPAPDHKHIQHNRHLDQRLVWDLSTHPAIIDRMASLYGGNLLMWRTNFFVKHPGGKEIPWHQDFNYWPLEPPVICSAWLAIDPATVENSCVQLIPGSHRRVLPHVKAGEEMEFNEQADGTRFDISQAINIELEPGQFFLFNERTLHHSYRNGSDKRRIGLAIRVILPIVKVLSWDSPNHRAVQVRGQDPMGINEKCEPPA